MAYKSQYSLGEFWDELVQGTLFKAYAKANPAEAAALGTIVRRKVNQEPYVLPVNVANTHTGKAIVMAINTLPGGPPT